MGASALSRMMDKKSSGTGLAVVLDLDLTLGYWGLASFAYNSFFTYTAGRAPPTSIFVQHHLSKGGARPHLIQLLQTLNNWKAAGDISEVVIFTSATNAEGWVTFLVQCLEEYARTPFLFGRTFAREDAPLVGHVQGQPRIRKDLSRVGLNPDLVVLVDDKPDLAFNGRVLAVPEYWASVPSAGLEQAIKELLPHLAAKISDDFEVDRQRYPPDQCADCSADNTLMKVIAHLSQDIKRLKCPLEHTHTESCC